MKKLILIYGESGSGKSALAQKVRESHGFEILSLDELYVNFIKDQCPEYYFERLGDYIAPHYTYILVASGYTKRVYGRDYGEQWRQHLLSAAIAKMASHDAVVVEGWMLLESLRPLVARLSQEAKFIVVEAKNGANLIGGRPVTVAQILQTLEGR